MTMVEVPESSASADGGDPNKSPMTLGASDQKHDYAQYSVKAALDRLRLQGTQDTDYLLPSGAQAADYFLAQSVRAISPSSISEWGAGSTRGKSGRSRKVVAVEKRRVVRMKTEYLGVHQATKKGKMPFIEQSPRYMVDRSGSMRLAYVIPIVSGFTFFVTVATCAASNSLAMHLQPLYTATMNPLPVAFFGAGSWMVKAPVPAKYIAPLVLGLAYLWVLWGVAKTLKRWLKGETKEEAEFKRQILSSADEALDNSALNPRHK